MAAADRADRTADVAHGAQPSGLARTFTAFRYRNFRLLWGVMAASMTAMQMQQIAQGWLAFKLAGNFTGVGIVMMAWGIPQLLMSLIGGAVADRMDKRRLMVLTQSTVGLTALATAVLITTGHISLQALFAMGVVQGIAFSFNMPARQALLAEIVPRRDLMNALALNNSAMNATRVIAPSVAGAMIAAFSVQVVYYAAASCYLVVLAFALMLPPSTSHLAAAGERGSVRAEIGVGLRYIWNSRDLRLLLLMAFVPIVLGMPYNALLPGFAVDELRRGSAAYGMMSTVAGVGALVGSIGIASLAGYRRVRLLQAGVGLGFGLGLLALGFASAAFGYSGALVALLGLGLCSMSYMTLNNTLIMTASEPAFYGRVMSVYMLTFSVFPLMSGPMGVAADRITAQTTFEMLGTGIVVFMAIVIALNPRFVFSQRGALADAERDADDAPLPSAQPHAAGAAVSAVHGTQSTTATAARYYVDDGEGIPPHR